MISDPFLYIPISPESKRPIAEFGGWPIDPDERYVAEREDVDDSSHDWWAVVGHKTSNLLIIDIDMYKMSDAEIAEVEYGWYGILDDTRIVKTPSGGLHVYLRTDADIDDLPRPRDNIDLKGDVARGYALAFPQSEYQVKNDVRPAKVSEELLRELPAFDGDEARGERNTADPIVSEEEMRAKTAPPCLGKALDDDSEFAERLTSAVKYGTVDKLSVYRVLDKANYPESSNEAAPSFLHATSSSTGTNFRVDEGAETFRCWRHDCTGNAYHLIGVKAGIIECGDWTHEKVDMGAIKEYARNNGYVTEDDVITCDTVKSNGLCPFECGRRHPFDGVVE